ncbi:MAG: tetratricopeptide repeat protein [Candidatus Omnitrophota bacterium]
MKFFGKNMLIVMLILLAGCASTSRKFSFKYDLMTLAKDSSQGNEAQLEKDFSEYGSMGIPALINKAAKEPDNDALLTVLAKAEYDQGEYKKALSDIDKAINIKNYGMMGMRIAVEGVAVASMNIAQAIVVSVENLMKEKYQTKACLITEVEKDGPADKAGLKVGDKLISIDDINLLNYAVVESKLEKYIKGKQPGVSVEVCKYGAPKRTKLILGQFKDPQLPYKLALKSLLLVKIGSMDEALECAQKSLDNNMSTKTSELLAKQAMGNIYIARGKYADASNILTGLTETVGVCILKAKAYAKQGDFNKAIRLYEEKIIDNKSLDIEEHKELLKAFAPEVENMLNKAKQLEDKGKFQEALDGYSKAMLIMVEDDKEKIRDELFQITARMSSPPEISETAHKHALRAELLAKEGKFKDAIVEFKKALQEAPYSAKLYLNSALVLGKLENYKRAIEQMRVYIKAVPQAPNIREAEDMIIKWELESEQK